MTTTDVPSYEYVTLIRQMAREGHHRAAVGGMWDHIGPLRAATEYDSRCSVVVWRSPRRLWHVCPDDHPRGQPLLHHPGDVISHAEDDPFHYYTHQILGAADGLPRQVTPSPELGPSPRPADGAVHSIGELTQLLVNLTAT